MRFLDLAELSPAAEDAFGGKACGLARLIAAGARVPPGFAIEATAARPEEWSPEARESLHARAAVLLRDGVVAVRSSAVGEDSEARSFAGVFDSVLDVAEATAVIAAAARCIRSAAGPRARAYTGNGTPRVGVVVQRQVSARAAGVCFTLDPLGRDRAVLIEAVADRGEALVSGRTQPEAWRVHPTGLGTWDARRRDGSPSSVLGADEAVRIARDAAALAERFGHPLDLEWVLGADGLWWVQARPITASRPPREPMIERYAAGADDGPVTVWSNWNVRETMPDPASPLGWTVWRDVILPVVAEPLFGIPRSSPLSPHLIGIDRVDGRLYWNMNAMFALPLGRLFLRHGLAVMDARAAAPIAGLWDRGVLRPRRLPGSALGSRLRLWLGGLRPMSRLHRGLRPRRLLRALEACGGVLARRPDVRRLTGPELLREMRLIGEPESRPLHDGQCALGLAFVIYLVAQRAFRAHPEAQRLLVSGIEGNPTTAIALGIDALVEAARPCASLFSEPGTAAELLARLETTPAGREWLGRFREFLERFGHRGPREFEIMAPRWSEDPTMLVELVRAGLASPRACSARQRLSRLAAARREAIAAAVASSPWYRRPVLRALAALAAAYMPLREAPKHHAMHVFERMRAAALEAGRRFAETGLIASVEDVFFLEWPELQSLLLGPAGLVEPRRRVAERRAEFDAFLAARPPDLVRSDGVPEGLEEPAVPEDGVLRGAGAGPGRGSGPARILRAPDPRAMRDGDVIVVELADPAWTPLFPRAAAVVMEVGGLMCHAAVVARELGVPAVMGVAGATRLLQDGQRLVVDGDAGTVRVG
jgi:pyruvate,water dikinase